VVGVKIEQGFEIGVMSVVGEEIFEGKRPFKDNVFINISFYIIEELLGLANFKLVAIHFLSIWYSSQYAHVLRSNCLPKRQQSLQQRAFPKKGMRSIHTHTL